MIGVGVMVEGGRSDVTSGPDESDQDNHWHRPDHHNVCGIVCICTGITYFIYIHSWNL